MTAAASLATRRQSPRLQSNSVGRNAAATPTASASPILSTTDPSASSPSIIAPRSNTAIAITEDSGNTLLVASACTGGSFSQSPSSSILQLPSMPSTPTVSDHPITASISVLPDFTHTPPFGGKRSAHLFPPHSFHALESHIASKLSCVSHAAGPVPHASSVDIIPADPVSGITHSSQAASEFIHFFDEQLLNQTKLFLPALQEDGAATDIMSCSTYSHATESPAPAPAPAPLLQTLETSPSSLQPTLPGKRARVIFDADTLAWLETVYNDNPAITSAAVHNLVLPDTITAVQAYRWIYRRRQAQKKEHNASSQDTCSSIDDDSRASSVCNGETLGDPIQCNTDSEKPVLPSSHVAALIDMDEESATPFNFFAKKADLEVVESSVDPENKNIRTMEIHGITMPDHNTSTEIVDDSKEMIPEDISADNIEEISGLVPLVEAEAVMTNADGYEEGAVYSGSGSFDGEIECPEPASMPTLADVDMTRQDSSTSTNTGDSPVGADLPQNSAIETFDTAPISLASVIGEGNRELISPAQLNRFARYMNAQKTLQARLAAIQVLQNTTHLPTLSGFVLGKGVLLINMWLSEAIRIAGDWDSLVLPIMKLIARLPIDISSLKYSGLGKPVRRMVKSASETGSKKESDVIAGELMTNWTKLIIADKQATTVVSSHPLKRITITVVAPSAKRITVKPASSIMNTNQTSVSGETAAVDAPLSRFPKIRLKTLSTSASLEKTAIAPISIAKTESVPAPVSKPPYTYIDIRPIVPVAVSYSSASAPKPTPGSSGARIEAPPIKSSPIHQNLPKTATPLSRPSSSLTTSMPGLVRKPSESKPASHRRRMILDPHHIASAQNEHPPLPHTTLDLKRQPSEPDSESSVRLAKRQHIGAPQSGSILGKPIASEPTSLPGNDPLETMPISPGSDAEMEGATDSYGHAKSLSSLTAFPSYRRGTATSVTEAVSPVATWVPGQPIIGILSNPDITNVPFPTTTKTDSAVSARTGKIKKNVRFQSDDRLCKIRYIENVETLRTKEEDRVHARDFDRSEGQQAFQKIREEQQPLQDWAPPREFKLLAQLVRGRNSTECKVQEERERNALSSVYYSPSDIPPSPAEPSNIYSATTDDANDDAFATIIPLVQTPPPVSAVALPASLHQNLLVPTDTSLRPTFPGVASDCAVGLTSSTGFPAADTWSAAHMPSLNSVSSIPITGLTGLSALNGLAGLSALTGLAGLPALNGLTYTAPVNSTLPVTSALSLDSFQHLQQLDMSTLSIPQTQSHGSNLQWTPLAGLVQSSHAPRDVPAPDYTSADRKRQHDGYSPSFGYPPSSYNESSYSNTHTAQYGVDSFGASGASGAYHPNSLSDQTNEFQQRRSSLGNSHFNSKRAKSAGRGNSFSGTKTVPFGSPVCEHFKRGKCRYGNSCHNSHDLSTVPFK
ncbi:hypothetical protein BASA81_009675 [Batrachochytrium salamandrivorans]|nr:hypothetical protein BASA81_009675 [Batrachochytrium salamandrivorans]